MVKHQRSHVGVFLFTEKPIIPPRIVDLLVQIFKPRIGKTGEVYLPVITFNF